MSSSYTQIEKHRESPDLVTSVLKPSRKSPEVPIAEFSRLAEVPVCHPASDEDSFPLIMTLMFRSFQVPPGGPPVVHYPLEIAQNLDRIPAIQPHAAEDHINWPEVIHYLTSLLS